MVAAAGVVVAPKSAVASDASAIVNRFPFRLTVDIVPPVTVYETSCRPTVWPDVLAAIFDFVEITRDPLTTKSPVGSLKVIMLLLTVEESDKRLSPS